MKKMLLAVVVAMIGVIPATGQVQLSVMGGYSLFGSSNGFNIKDSFSGQAVIGKPIGFGRVVEFSYHRQDTYLEDLVGIGKQRLDMTSEYFQIGVAQEAAPGEDTTPYGLFSLGAVRYNPGESSDPFLNSLDDQWKFAINFGGGVKHYFSEKVGLRLSALLLMPLNWGGVGLFCGTGGCNVGAGSYAVFVQAELQAGLVFRLGE